VLFSYLLITVQFERNRELEKVKQRLGEVRRRESDSCFAVWKAIAQAYRLLSELERGTFDARSSENIAEAFGEAEIYIFILSAEHQGRFYSYWQKANELVALIPTAATAAEKQALWTARMSLLFASRSAMSSKTFTWRSDPTAASRRNNSMGTWHTLSTSSCLPNRAATPCGRRPGVAGMLASAGLCVRATDAARLHRRRETIYTSFSGSLSNRV
jgi:hypothetical protein